MGRIILIQLSQFTISVWPLLPRLNWPLLFLSKNFTTNFQHHKQQQILSWLYRIKSLELINQHSSDIYPWCEIISQALIDVINWRWHKDNWQRNLVGNRAISPVWRGEKQTSNYRAFSASPLYLESSWCPLICLWDDTRSLQPAVTLFGARCATLTRAATAGAETRGRQ